MSDNFNPYQPPESSVELAHATGAAGELGEPKKRPAGAGWEWITGGFGMFKGAPGQWILLIVVWFVILIGLQLIPIVSLLASVLSPIFIGGIMLGCRDKDQGNGIQINHLFAGFQKNAGQLALIGLLYLVGILIAVIIGGGLGFMLFGGDMMAAMEGADPSGGGAGILLVALLVMLLVFPLFMAYMFAPQLVVFHDLSAIAAMKLSFTGCLRNIVPFLIYGIAAMVLTFIAAIPLGLGLLVLLPTLVASMYVSYKDIFLIPANESV